MSDADEPVRPLGPFGDPPPAETPPPDDAATPPTDPGGATHYTTLETADRAARDFQSKFDSAQAKLQALEAKLARFGGLDQAETLIGQVSALANRPDFQAYARGGAAPPAPPADDEYLTDEQRQIRSLEAKIAGLERGVAQDRTQGATELATIRFERAEAEMRERYGDLWEARRPQVLKEVTKFASQTGPNGLNLVDTALLNRMYVASFDTPQEFEEAMTKWVTSRDAARRAQLASKGTTLPHTTAPAGKPTAMPKTLQEAWARGAEDRARAERERPVH